MNHIVTRLYIVYLCIVTEGHEGKEGVRR